MHPIGSYYTGVPRFTINKQQNLTYCHQYHFCWGPRWGSTVVKALCYSGDRGGTVVKVLCYSGDRGGTVVKVLCYSGDRDGTVVKVLCYKSVGRWFDPS